MEDRIYTLKNGLRVVNFSSPHSFTFTDGTILPAVSDELSLRLMLDVEEIPVPQRNARYKTVKLDWSLNERVRDEIDYWFTFFAMKKVDVVIIPFPVMTALLKIWNEKAVMKTPFRVIRMADRIDKSIYDIKFCIGWENKY